MVLEADLAIENCMILPMCNSGIIEKGIIAVKNNVIAYLGNLLDALKNTG